MEKSRKYDREFKINAIKLYRESGKYTRGISMRLL
jgi:transposase-like protein